jgi:hypothetical protein
LKYSLRILISKGEPISNKFGRGNREKGGKQLKRKMGMRGDKFLNKF